jgi:hypothetical protein
MILKFYYIVPWLLVRGPMAGLSRSRFKSEGGGEQSLVNHSWTAQVTEISPASPVRRQGTAITAMSTMGSLATQFGGPPKRQPQTGVGLVVSDGSGGIGTYVPSTSADICPAIEHLDESTILEDSTNSTIQSPFGSSNNTS